MRPSLTHFALHVADADRTAAFYEQFARMRIVRAWADQGEGQKVKWLKSADAANAFVLVLLEGGSVHLPGGPQEPIGPLSHFGFALYSREEVDAIAVKAEQAGVLLKAPREAGGTVGYICYLRDPNGHSVEFSYGQVLE